MILSGNKSHSRDKNFLLYHPVTVLSTIMAERNADSDIYKKFVVLPENIRKEVMEWFRGSKEVRIFITGKTGVGKSTLVNGLVGKVMAKEGDTLDPETSKVKSYEKQHHCVKVTVWDSPGLQDGTSNEANYLKDMKRRCSGMDICIYCVSLMETRFTEGCADIVAMKKLTSVFGKKMWENAVFVSLSQTWLMMWTLRYWRQKMHRNQSCSRPK